MNSCIHCTTSTSTSSQVRAIERSARLSSASTWALRRAFEDQKRRSPVLLSSVLFSAHLISSLRVQGHTRHVQTSWAANARSLNTFSRSASLRFVSCRDATRRAAPRRASGCHCRVAQRTAAQRLVASPRLASSVRTHRSKICSVRIRPISYRIAFVRADS